MWGCMFSVFYYYSIKTIGWEVFREVFPGALLCKPIYVDNALYLKKK